MAQTSLYFGAEKVVVVLNPLTDVPERELPFDRNFFIRKFLPKSDSNSVVSATLLEVKNPTTYDTDARSIFIPVNLNNIKALTGIKLDVKPAVDKIELNANGFDLFVTKPLKPNRQYDIIVVATPTNLQANQLVEAFYEMHFRQGGVYKDRVIKLIDAINLRKRQQLDATPIEQIEFVLYYHQHLKSRLPPVRAVAGVDTLKLRKELVKLLQKPKVVVECLLTPPRVICFSREAFEQTFVLYNSSTIGFKLDTRAKSILQPDFGAIAYGLGGDGWVGLNKDFMGVVPYVGLNLLFRPFDPDVRLRQLPKNHVHCYDRLSIHAGLTLTSLAKDKYRANLISNFNLMLGGGYRISSSFKLVTGVILYRRLNENPLFTDSSVNAVGYAGLSIDIRIRDTIGDIGKLLFSK
jgi:hypothetical protein